MARMVKTSVSVDAEMLRLAKAHAEEEGVSLSAFLMRGLQREIDARARLEAALRLYGQEGWPKAEERRGLVKTWTTKAKRRRSKRRAA
jgi:hypothetical protein